MITKVIVLKIKLNKFKDENIADRIKLAVYRLLRNIKHNDIKLKFGYVNNDFINEIIRLKITARFKWY